VTASSRADLVVDRARVGDVREIKRLVDEYAGPILLEKTLANLFEDVTEFWVARLANRVVGCGALHVLWDALG
jgi:amino-acid N-acetyltransferase